MRLKKRTHEEQINALKKLSRNANIGYSTLLRMYTMVKNGYSNKEIKTHGFPSRVAVYTRLFHIYISSTIKQQSEFTIKEDRSYWKDENEMIIHDYKPSDLKGAERRILYKLQSKDRREYELKSIYK